MTSASLERIVVIGLGRMGRSIAHVFAYAGYEVAIVDLKPRAPADFAQKAGAAKAEIEADLATLASLGRFDPALVPTILERIHILPEAEADRALARADIVFEAVPEAIEPKRSVFERVSAVAPEHAILASTTSTILSDTLAGFVRDPGRFLNAHWLNPAPLIPLVELSPAAATRPEVTDRMKALLEGIGKVPVVCRPSPGFIVPRLQILAMNEAARMVAEGVATVEEIDRATRFGLGFRFAVLGVLEFIDFGGTDILARAGAYMADATGESRFRPPAIVDRHMHEGRLGVASGRGFYDWRSMDVARHRREKLSALLALSRLLGLERPPGSAAAAAAFEKEREHDGSHARLDR